MSLEAQYKDWIEAENKIFLGQLLNVFGIVEQAIPIYTIKKPNPKSGKEDCPQTTADKKRFREIMREKISEAASKEEVNNIIDKYKKMFE